MTHHDVDVAILGAGTAGMRAARAARAHADRVLLIQDGPYGTVCAREGCMPSKLLIAAAHAAHAAGEAWRFGADARRAPEVDGAAVMARVRAERDRFVGFVLEDVDALPVEHLRGRARFTGPGRLAVGEHTVSARAVVVATGSRPVALPLFAAVADRVLTTSTFFDLPTLPRSVAVFGPGVIGLELGQSLHRLGVRTQIFGVGGAVGPLTDPALRRLADEVFSAELPLLSDAKVLGVEPHGEGVRVRFVGPGGAETAADFDALLSAVGRRPNLDGLGWEHTGAELDPRGLPRFDRATLQVRGAPIFLAGDATGERTLLHEASDEGSLAGQNAGRWPEVEAPPRRSPLAIAFSDPQIGMVGESWAELQAAGAEVVVGRVGFVNQGRSRVMLQNRGALHVYADRHTGRLRGAEGLGPDLEHLAHLLAWVHQLGLTVGQILELPFYHPVVEEGLRTALRDAKAQLDRG